MLKIPLDTFLIVEVPADHELLPQAKRMQITSAGVSVRFFTWPPTSTDRRPGKHPLYIRILVPRSSNSPNPAQFGARFTQLVAQATQRNDQRGGICYVFCFGQTGDEFGKMGLTSYRLVLLDGPNLHRVRINYTSSQRNGFTIAVADLGGTGSL